MKYNLLDLVTIKKREKSQALPLWRRVALFFIIAGLAFFAFVIASLYIAGGRLGREVIRINKAGEPLAFTNGASHAAHLRPRPVPPATEDAADHYVDAMRQIQPGQLSELIKVNTFYRVNLAMPAPNPLPDDIRKTVTQDIARAQPLFDKFDKGARHELTGFDTGVLAGRQVCRSRLDGVQAAVLLLSLRTLNAISTGDDEKAAQSIESTLKLMRIFDAQPTMFVQTVKAACVRFACSDVLLLLSRCRLSQEHLAKIQVLLEETMPADCLEKTLLAERVYQVEIARNLLPQDVASKYLTAQEPNLPERLELSRFMWYRMRLRWLYVKYLKDKAWYIEQSRLPWPVPLDKIIDANSTSSGRSRQLAGAVTTLSRLMAENLATVRCTMTAVAIERYRLKKGALPASLNELYPQFVEAVPLDPFTAGTLLYTRDEDFYTVYSTGFNRTDDNGSVTPRQQNAVILDSGVRVKRNVSK